MAPIDKLSDGGAPVLKVAAIRKGNVTTNRTMVSEGGGFGEEMRTGGTRGGGRLPIVSGGKLRDKKIKIERAMGPQISMAPAAWDDATTNQKATQSLGYMVWCRPGWTKNS
jgi:hypothetical protein